MAPAADIFIKNPDKSRKIYIVRSLKNTFMFIGLADFIKFKNVTSQDEGFLKVNFAQVIRLIVWYKYKSEH